LRCEVCGHKIYGKPQRVIIEGAKLTVCSQCAKHGTAHWEEPTPKMKMPKPKATLPPLRTQSKKPSEIRVDASLELVENFDMKIRQAREKLGLTHEELGKKINEKVSVLRKIETRRITPDNKLAAKLEHALKIKLIAPSPQEKIPPTKIPKPASREVTLGDLIQLTDKDEEKEETTERKPS